MFRPSITALAILANSAFTPTFGQRPDVKELINQPSANPLIRTMGEVIRLPKVGSATETNLKIGDSLPLLKCIDLEGNSVDIDQLYGDKATLVVFWATWCSACVLDLPHERGIAGVYRDRGLKVIGVNADDDATLAKTCIDLHYLTWPMIHEPKDRLAEDGIVKRLAIWNWPTVLLFDENRKLIHATPSLRTRYSMRDAAGNSYSVRGIDAALARTLGPLNLLPKISIVD